MCSFAMLFPGQGSQNINMLSSFFQKKNNIFKQTFNEASEYIKFNLLKLIQEGPKEKLNYSKYTQPAILTASIAIYRFWVERNGKIPSFMAGHSLGEYSALVCSNAMQFSDAIKIVSLRGKWMEKLATKKLYQTKAIIGLDQKIIENICLRFLSKNIYIASINNKNQIIISGKKSSIEKAIISFKKNGVKNIFDLNINFPVHSILMKPIAEKLYNILKLIKIKSPEIPVINNVYAKKEYSSHLIKIALMKQMYNTVRWSETIDLIKLNKVFIMLEIGPNKILTNLNRNQNNITSFSTNNLKNFLISFKIINKNYENKKNCISHRC